MKQRESYFDTTTKIKHHGASCDTVGDYTVIDCEPCGFKHIAPFPSQEAFAKLYEDTYYVSEKPQYFRYMEEDLEWWNLHYKNRYAIFEKFISNKKILDIGSGPGYFLKCGDDLGWKTLGFEPSKQAAEYSRKLGLNIINDFFSKEKVKNSGPFDVVNLETVLEHHLYPIQMLEEVKEILKPGGIVCIISPNDYNPLQKILREQLKFDPWWVVPLQHINYFDTHSVQKILIGIGLTILEVMGTFPMEFFLLSGENYIGNDAIGRACHKKRKIFEANLFSHYGEKINTFYRTLAQYGMGRDFIVIARKT